NGESLPDRAHEAVPDNAELASVPDTGELASVPDTGDLESMPDAEPASSATEHSR
ncbi:MAG: hypothetical protein QOF99_874, partial [Pseudonocardiales bacterium]|nr:hypothetical protein [Pseudonocardiales bacterium]